MSTKVYLDLVWRPHGVGEGVPLPFQFPPMSRSVRVYLASRPQKT